MSQYACNPEGIELLKKAQQEVTDCLEKIESATSGMAASVEGYQNIGPHKDKLEGALESIAQSVKNAGEPASSVAEKLGRVAEKYQEIVDNDPFISLGN